MDVKMIASITSFLIMLGLLIACDPSKDLARSPAELNHNRALMFFSTDDDERDEVGIAGVIDAKETFELRTYGSGSATLRGMGDCGYVEEKSIGDVPRVSFDLNKLPDKELCVYGLTVRANRLDAPAIGKLIVRKFKDPNIQPLKTTVNRKTRKGVNWVQLREQPVGGEYSSGSNLKDTGIYEDKEIIVYPSGSKGKMIVTGCGLREVYQYSSTPWKTTVDNLYKAIKKIDKDCVFTITANNDDALKESASIFVGVYQEEGGYLTAPRTYTNLIDRCFAFDDKNVVVVRVNGRLSGVNDQDKCVSKRVKTYYVEAITSKLRLFYGVYSNKEWVEVL